MKARTYDDWQHKQWQPGQRGRPPGSPKQAASGGGGKRVTPTRSKKEIQPKPSKKQAEASKRKSRMELLEEAVDKVSKQKGMHIFELFIERAYHDDGVLIAVMRKFIPDLKSIEAFSVDADTLSPEEANTIRNKMRERFEGLFNNSSKH